MKPRKPKDFMVEGNDTPFIGATCSVEMIGGWPRRFIQVFTFHSTDPNTARKFRDWLEKAVRWQKVEGEK